MKLKLIFIPILCVLGWLLAFESLDLWFVMISEPDTLMCTAGIVMLIADIALLNFCLIHFFKSISLLVVNEIASRNDVSVEKSNIKQEEKS